MLNNYRCAWTYLLVYIINFPLQHLISDAMAKRSGLDPDIWCKIIYMEKEQGIAKFYVREEELTIDGSFIEYDGIR